MRRPAVRPAIGVLAVQGDFAAHVKRLRRLGATATEVRTVADLASVQGLVLPGGESTTMIRHLDHSGLTDAIKTRAAAGMPVLGTCAGLILMARIVDRNPEQRTLGLVDFDVERNAFGRQVDSFEREVQFTAGGESHAVRGVFIRAPRITRVGAGVAVAASSEGDIVAVTSGPHCALAFHPELTGESVIHAYFIDCVRAASGGGASRAA